MIWLVWTLVFVCVSLLVLLFVSIRYNLKLATLIFSLEEMIEESLESLDASHDAINQVLEVPVGSDDPFVVAVVSEIKHARETILAIADKLTTEWKEPKENDESREEDDNEES